MNLHDLSKAVSEKSNLTQEQSLKFIHAFEQVIFEKLSQGEEVQLVGFGTFKCIKRATHNGVNPRTHEKIIIQETVTPTFKAGENFKRAVRENLTK